VEINWIAQRLGNKFSFLKILIAIQKSTRVFVINIEFPIQYKNLQILVLLDSIRLR